MHASCRRSTFFDDSPKTFKEERWWLCLLVSNRRVFLFHAVSFGACIALSRPPSWSSAFNGWGASVFFVVVLMLAPLSSAAGAIFDWWSTSDERSRIMQRKRLGFTLALLIPLVAAAAGVVFILSNYTTTEIENAELGSMPVVVLLVSSTLLVSGGLWWFVAEMMPQRELDEAAFDAHLDWERGIRSVATQSWLVERSWYKLRPEIASAVKMHLFWAAVWVPKNALALLVLVPALFDMHTALEDAVPAAAFEPAAAQGWVFDAEPAQLLRLACCFALWVTGATVYVADTLLWYSMVMGLWGGMVGVCRQGVAKGSLTSVPAVESRDGLEPLAIEKLLQGDGPKSAAAWKHLWQYITEELYTRDLISSHERAALLEGDTNVHLANVEARRRLAQFARSLNDPCLQASRGALRSPGMTVLVPHYAEQLLVPYESLDAFGKAHKKQKAPKTTDSKPREADSDGITIRLVPLDYDQYLELTFSNIGDGADEVGAPCYTVTGPRDKVDMLERTRLDRALDRALLNKKAAVADTAAPKGVSGQLSPLDTVTVPPEMRASVGIPADAAFFAFVYPADGVEELLEELDLTQAKWAFLLLLGGYVYFDSEKRQLAINAMTLGGDEEEVVNGNPVFKFHLHGPFPAAPQALEALAAQSRLCDVTLSELKGQGFAKFCWVHSSEAPGGVSLSTTSTYVYGAFAYTRTNGEPIFFVLDTKGDTIDEGSKRKNASDAVLTVFGGLASRVRTAAAENEGMSDAVHSSVMGFLVAYHKSEWTNFSQRMDSTLGASKAATGTSDGTTDEAVLSAAMDAAVQRQKATAVRLWASLRLQTMYRTIAGMMKNREAFGLLLRASLPDLPESDLSKLLDTKFRCLAALQRYDVMTPAELEDVEFMLSQFPSLTVRRASNA